jgi:GH24 family phage-related lysozyme (muramidase)
MVERYPEIVRTHPHCQGALLSLVINRGTSLGKKNTRTWNRRKEMRDILNNLKNGNVKEVAIDIRNMKRIWEGKGLGGLIARRELEAKAFEDFGDCTCYIK